MAGLNNPFAAPATPSIYDVQRRSDLAKRLAENDKYVPNSGFFGALGQALAGAGSGFENTTAANEAQTGSDQAKAALAKALSGGYAGVQADPGGYVTAAGNSFLSPGAASAANSYVGAQGQLAQQGAENAALMDRQVQQQGYELNKPQVVTGYETGSFVPATGKMTPFYGSAPSDSSGPNPSDPVGNLVGAIEGKEGYGKFDPNTFKSLPQALRSAVLQRIATDGFNLQDAQLNQLGANRQIATANGPKETMFNSAANTVYKTMDLVDGFANQWATWAGKYPAINKVTLEAASQGALIPILGEKQGTAAMNAAIMLKNQIGDAQAEVASMFRQGNSPTEGAFDLSKNQIDPSLPIGVILSQTKLVRANAEKRIESMKEANLGVGTGGAVNPILAGTPGAPQPGAGQTAAPPIGTIEDGYRFKGGDPGDQNNWEPVS